MKKKVAHSMQGMLKLFGVLLVVLSLGYVGTLLWAQRSTLIGWRPSVIAVLVLICSVLAYAVAGILLATAWRSLLLWTGENRVCSHDTLRIYGRSQIAKYIPGNVAQFAGRHVNGRQLGWSHTGLVIAGALELVSLIFIASVIAVIGLSWTGVATEILSLPTLSLLACSLIVATIFLVHVVPKIVRRRWPTVAARIRSCRVVGLWKVGLLHFFFFLTSGMIFLVIGVTVFNTVIPSSLWPGVLGLVACAWVAGIITPGAPSGLGVREGVLVLGLKEIAPVGEILLLVGLFRLITVFGDLLFFLGVSVRRT